ncbi:MAG TPA: type II CAAX endopeptidase family protein, partial [Verrucomicrobiae bacterium]|nr:type II CAAX endopeptidase family protein [Verrucomicrobiae bacterium]
LLLGIVVCFGWVSLAGGAAQHYSGHEKLDENSLLYLVLITMSLHGSILLATAVALWWFHISWGEAFGFTRGGTGRAMVLGALAGVVFLPVGWMLQLLSGGILNAMHRDVPVQEAVQTMQKADTLDCRVYFVVFSIFIAPVAEEILFRGILYPAIKQFGFPRSALWGTAVLFAAIHVNLPIFLPLLALGLALALLYEATNNLLAPIAAHGLFNAVNIVVFYLNQDAPHPFHK